MGQKEDPAVANHVSGQSNDPISKPPHVLPFDQVVQELKTNGDDGLTPQEAQKRLDQYGRNQFGESAGVQPLRILGAQLANAMTLVSSILPSSLLFVVPFALCARQSSGFVGNCRIGCLSNANDVIAPT